MTKREHKQEMNELKWELERKLLSIMYLEKELKKKDETIQKLNEDFVDKVKKYKRLDTILAVIAIVEALVLVLHNFI
jgi:CII-binding regulator of phage lambda lysogenization HflD